MSSPASSTTAHDANGSSESTTTIRERTLTQQNGRIMPLLTSAHERRHPFFGVKDPEVRKLRNATMKQLGLSIGLITVVLWVCLPIFWYGNCCVVVSLELTRSRFVQGLNVQAHSKPQEPQCGLHRLRLCRFPQQLDPRPCLHILRPINHCRHTRLRSSIRLRDS